MSDSPREMVLLVDDDGALVSALTEAMHTHGWKPVTASTVAGAVALAGEHAPGIAVVAHGLPDGDGNQLIQELRRRCPGMLCLLMTCHPDVGTAMGAVRARAYAYLVKPFPAAQLLALLDAARETLRLRHDYQQQVVRVAELQTILEASRIVQDRINNPLQGIMGRADLIRTLMPDLPPRPKKLLDDMIRSCEQTGDIVHHLAQVVTQFAQRRTAEEMPDVRMLFRMLASVDDELPGGLPGPTPSPGPANDDRRSSQRYSCRNLMLSVPGAAGGRWHFVDNVSQGGVGVVLLDAEGVPPCFEARLWDLESHESIAVAVEVRWRQEGVPAAIGVRFVGQDGEDQAWLDAVVARLQAKRTTPAEEEPRGSA